MSNAKWEKELVKELDVTWGDAKAILQIAKDELGIDQKDYPEESKEQVFAKCREVGESFEKTPKPDKPKEVKRQPSSGEDEPGKEEEKAEDKAEEVVPTWEEELAKELDVTLDDATAILQVAKNELEIDQKEYPESQKAAVFEKCKVVSKYFDKSPKPKEEKKKAAAAVAATAGATAAVASKDAAAAAPKTDDDAAAAEVASTGSATRKSKYEEPQGIDQKQLTVAVICAIFVIAVVVGVAVGVTRNRSADDEDAPPTSAPTAVVEDCELQEWEFAVPSLDVTLAVNSEISQAEIDYAASIFLKTYTAVLQGLVDGADYCDPYCRTVTDVEIVGSTLTGNVTNQTFVELGCDDTLVLTFAVDGTYQSCEADDWPGLFTEVEARRLASSNSFLRGAGERFLQSNSTCGECPDDSTSLGQIAPSEEELALIMDPFISILPNVCELVSVTVIEAADDMTNITMT